jgi:hypothetical protein
MRGDHPGELPARGPTISGSGAWGAQKHVTEPPLDQHRADVRAERRFAVHCPCPFCTGAVYRPGRRRAGPDMTAPPELVLARACRAGAQVASRRKAHHGSSRTVFHEGSGQARGTLTHRREYNARPASAIPAAGTASEIAPDLPDAAGSGLPPRLPGRLPPGRTATQYGELGVQRAGDGNRTRMTSLEG